MHLYFARHAQSQNNALEGHPDYFTRRSEDPGITETGWKQAEALGELIAGDAGQHATARSHRLYRNPWNHEGFGITHIYCSLQRRAVETASCVASALDMDVIGWAPIHECGGVVCYEPESAAFVGRPGATPETIRGWYPRIQLGEDALPAGWWDSRPIEAREQSVARAKLVFRELLERHGGTDDHVLFVSHSMFYVYLMCEMLGTPFRNELWFTLNNCAVTRLDIGDGDDYEPGMDAGMSKLAGNPVRVTYMNRIDHLPVEIVT
jgi:2,3-bisphosphoglycerate-dependent phosphoglycerate mutase